jgi:poly(3-hydroxybutyrate) depolymerase
MISMWARLSLPLLAVLACGQDLPRGQIIDSVKCLTQPEQQYALYVPSNYSAARQWSAIFAFDPGARGRVGVERFQAAAEKYGYIVAGSLNSRNGPWEPSLEAAKGMMADVMRRFSIDTKRIYTAGQSGGARVALAIALESNQIAGVFASSAGFPDEIQKSVPFPIFGKTAVDDFNYLELKALDRVVTTPHRVVVTEGGHAWMSSATALEAVGWMELQAMKSGRRARDPELLDRIFSERVAQVNAQANAQANAQNDGLEAVLALESLAADFQGLKDVTKFTQRAAALRNQKDVQREIAEDHLAEQREAKQTNEIYALRGESMERLKARVMELSRQAKSPDDSTDRRIARRILSGFGASFRGVRDPQLQEVVTEARSWNPAPPPEAR